MKYTVLLALIGVMSISEVNTLRIVQTHHGEEEEEGPTELAQGGAK